MANQFRHALTRIAVAAAIVAVVHVSSANAQKLTSGIDTSNFDHSVRPQDDFFRYVNGGWLKKTEIPGDASSWGAFPELTERSRNALHGILEETSHASGLSGEKKKVGDLYASFIDSARIEKLGLTPLAGEMKSIAAIQTAAQLPGAFAHFARLGVQGPLGVSVGQDPKASSVNITQAGQSGLGLPDRDY